MTLEKYTSTYTDIDSNVFDSDDLVNEFNRVAEYLNAWASSIELIGRTEVYVEEFTVINSIINIEPENGFIQSVVVNDDVDNVTVNFAERATGNTYRIYLTLRFQNKDTTFYVSGPTGKTHIFGRNAESYLPCQVSRDNYYSAMCVATYGETGLLIQVAADNAEASAVANDDIQTLMTL